MALGLYWATACLCLFLAVLAADIMGFFSKKNHFEVDGRVGKSLDAVIVKLLTLSIQTVVVTGGSQGMGRGLGKLLAQKGANVVIVARNQHKLDEALQYISVCSLAINSLTPRLTGLQVRCQKPTNPTLSRHQRKRDQARGERTSAR